MLCRILSQKTLIYLFLFSANVLFAQEAKFEKKGERISLTKSGVSFVDSVASKQVTGTIRKITKQEAYKWIDKFVKLSNKKAQQSPDFTPLNNFYNHLVLCDDLLMELRKNPNDELGKNEEIPQKRKEQLVQELEKLRAKLREDVRELVHPASQERMKKLLSFYDIALKETLDLQ